MSVKRENAKLDKDHGKLKEALEKCHISLEIFERYEWEEYSDRVSILINEIEELISKREKWSELYLRFVISANVLLVLVVLRFHKSPEPLS